MNKWETVSTCFACGHLDAEHRDPLKDGGNEKCTHDGCECKQLSKDYGLLVERLRKPRK